MACTQGRSTAPGAARRCLGQRSRASSNWGSASIGPGNEIGLGGAACTQPAEPLTAREEEVLIKVARGRTNAEIADELYISLSTAKTHLASLMAKLGARNQVELAMWAYETDRVKS